MKGVVVSLKNSRTAVVRVERTFRHHRLLKILLRHKKFSCHLPDSLKPRLGQRVAIRESSPRSATKRWEVYEAYDD